MDETDKKIRELTETMRVERDIRIRNRMMAVLGVLKGHSTRIASDFADGATVSCPVRRGRHRWPPGRFRKGKAATRGVRADQETGRQAYHPAIPRRSLGMSMSYQALPEPAHSD